MNIEDLKKFEQVKSAKIAGENAFNEGINSVKCFFLAQEVKFPILVIVSETIPRTLDELVDFIWVSFMNSKFNGGLSALMKEMVLLCIL